jgi:hypothetical protein
LQPTTRIEIIGTSLRSIWEDRGRLVAEDVVDDATPEDHPLHSFFEWDDTEAGRKYRIWQAGQLIRSVKILVEASTNGDIEDFKIREWVPARAVGLGRGHYVPEEQVRQHPDQQARLLREMRRALAAVERRYKHLDLYYKAEIRRFAAETTGAVVEPDTDTT